ncbi:NAD(P)H-dependent oxidoreductase subunit E [Undibacterium seohonense]|uniref:NAD(P)H-dependent oxidoreductase subunit E n=1 Tax=Undibacterium seohonense TaxID=1344950 RepID=A0ABR6X9H3_9BURK|nr:NAD(P)H-dependent oxidoreductase subunit E [Undibacterium seohonense]MBC3808964.1 NAD(P)H-dependent oxidoreductase subunit E [Undibacterium seohonense]
MLSDHQRETVHSAILEHQSKQFNQGSLLPILHAIQDRLGFIPADATPIIAKAMNLSRAEVHGVITFYHHFRQEQPAKTIVQICRAEACQSMGAEALWQHACQRASSDGAITLEPVYCLGLCSTAPAMSVNERPYARVNVSRFDQLLERHHDAQTRSAALAESAQSAKENT